MQYKWLTAAVLAVASVGASASDRATEDDIVKRTLQTYFTSEDDGATQERITMSHDRLRDLSRADMDREVGAVVILSHGLTPEEIESLSVEYELGISGVHVNHPIDDRGTVFSVFLGARDLSLPIGSLSDRIERSIGREKLKLATFLHGSSDNTNMDMYQFIIAENPKAYRLEVVATTGSLLELADSSATEAIVYDEEDRIIASFKTQRLRPIEVPGSRTLIQSGRPFFDGIPAELQSHRIYAPFELPTVEMAEQLLRTTKEAQ